MIPLIIAGQAAAGILGVVSGSIAANKARIDKQRYEQELLDLENNRQEIINPYKNIKDLSSMLSNPLANLGVATQAAEFQAEQADISLANTLDTLQASGASAGGATALAQAAIASKKGISASIEQQEAANSKLKAQGEQNLQSMKQQEAVRVQGARMGEAQRMQNVDVAGKEFMYQETEARETAKMNRVAGQQAGAKQAEIQARQDKAGAIGGAISGIGNIATSLIPSVPSDAKTTTTSDRRLKNSIEFIKLSSSGLKIYNFKYNNKPGVYQGVMSDEIPKHAIVKHSDGFDRVDYSKLDVEFKQISL